MPSVDSSARQYWRGPEDPAAAAELRRLAARSFPGMSWESIPLASRRQFLQMMGASLALSGLVGCRWPKEEIVPFSRPSGTQPGIPISYATSLEIAGVARGLLVTTVDGRPIKVEGNPDHPGSLGAADAISQASLLEVYDPGRSKSVVRRQAGQRRASTWDEFIEFARVHFVSLKGARGEGLRILSEESASDSVRSMRDRLLTDFPEARWHTYEPLARDNERAGSRIAFGRAVRSHLRLDRAERIVCLDADPLMTHPNAVRHARDFAASRRVESGRMSRLVSIEGVYSVTGAMADERHRVESRRIAGAAATIARALVERGYLALPEGSAGLIESLSRIAAESGGFPFAEAIAADLDAHRGRSLLIAGDRQPAAVHALVHLLNAALGNVGTTIAYTEEAELAAPEGRREITALVSEIRAGRVGTLVVIGGNPAYDAPAEIDLATLLRSIPITVRIGLHEDETSAACMWHLPRAHALESWGDARAYDGTTSLIQPMIEPLYGGKTPIELLSILVDSNPRKGYDIVRETATRLDLTGDPDLFWRRCLHDGIISGTDFAPAAPSLDPRRIREAVDRLPPGGDGGGLELVFLADPKVHDGRFANNAWLQEMPDPLTKITWDNALLMAPATAASFGLRADDVVAVNNGGREIEIPVYPMPGMARGTLAVSLGYGRTAAGKVGDGVGADSYRLRVGGLDIAFGVSLRKTDRTHALACTQNHHAIDSVGLKGTRERLGALVREADFASYEKHPDFAKHIVHHPPLVSLWKDHEFDGHRWGMSIDLNACIGCSACVVACQAENNIPVVGRDEVRRSREMHWIRIDRYYSGDAEAPEVVHQPVACVQCENAPCEQVCPVAATTHSQEGLNQMTYNRCIGTRYCANNCPYKVRRFNWFNNHKKLTQIEKMVMNPEVTVRGRGVMEKCTFCVQRIETAKIRAKNEGRPLKDGEIVPACAQTCPSQAIVFGDLNDPESRICKMHDNPRSYGLLEELNTRPRTVYLAKIRNPIAQDAGADHGRHG